MRRLLATVTALVFGVFALHATSAWAEEPPCVLNTCLGLKPAPEPDRVAQPTQPALGPASSTSGQGSRSAGAGDFDFYVLALSWSPGFCATGGADKAKSQCANGSNLGFVVHGLWPQNSHGYPSDCAPAGRFPSRQALETVRGLYPDEGLARYEWRRHGTCSGKSPTDYFADVRRARDAVTIPQPFQAPRENQTWVPIDIARAFAAANPGVRPDTMAVTCRQSVLEEVRLCLSKDLRAEVPCPEVARASCRLRQIEVPALR